MKETLFSSLIYEIYFKEINYVFLNNDFDEILISPNDYDKFIEILQSYGLKKVSKKNKKSSIFKKIIKQIFKENFLEPKPILIFENDTFTIAETKINLTNRLCFNSVFYGEDKLVSVDLRVTEMFLNTKKKSPSNDKINILGQEEQLLYDICFNLLNKKWEVNDLIKTNILNDYNIIKTKYGNKMISWYLSRIFWNAHLYIIDALEKNNIGDLLNQLIKYKNY